jgi:hypothetical protein
MQNFMSFCNFNERKIKSLMKYSLFFYLNNETLLAGYLATLIFLSSYTSSKERGNLKFFTCLIDEGVSLLK